MPYAASDPACAVLDRPSPETLRALANDTDPEGLIVHSYRLPSLDALAVFRRLTVLKINGAPKLTGLEGIEALGALRELVIGLAKPVRIPSLAPLAALQHLERLSLGGLQPRDRDLAVLERLPALRSLDLRAMDDFGLEDFARLAARLPDVEGRCLQPYFTIPGLAFCRVCKAPEVMLTGARGRRRLLCPSCDAERLAQHVGRWQTIAK